MNYKMSAPLGTVWYVGPIFSNCNVRPPLEVTTWGPTLEELHVGPPFVIVNMVPLLEITHESTFRNFNVALTLWNYCTWGLPLEIT